MRITRERLEQARTDLEAALGDDPRARLLEPLGRVHRWLDERQPATRRYREAADDVRETLDRYEERQNGHRMARVGTLLWRASDGRAALPWIERALRAGTARDVAAALHYLAEDFDHAIADARDAAEDPDDRPYPYVEAIEVLSIARRDEDGDRATRARETFAGLIRQERTPPWEESGSVDLSLFDWFEEAALVEAWLHEERQPGHAELLELLSGSP